MSGDTPSGGDGGTPAAPDPARPVGATAAVAPPVADAALALHGVEAGYGSFRALFGVDLAVAPGGALAIVGANGAGKSTVARVATGLVRPTAGTVQVGGRDLTAARTVRFARAGVLHVAEGRSVFAPLTVEENLRLGHRDRAGRAAAVERALETFPALAGRRRQLAGTLSGGEQRMLSLATAVADQPGVLVADEPSLGLSPAMIDAVYGHLAAIRAAGTALVVIEQKVAHTLELCDAVVLLRRGTVEWSGPSADAGDVLAGSLGRTL